MWNDEGNGYISLIKVMLYAIGFCLIFMYVISISLLAL